MELIELADIQKTYYLGEIAVPVLKGVTLTVASGELVALMGASGSGKSTLMNILGCLDRPTSGAYHLEGQEISHLSPDRRARLRNRKLGFVFQNFNLLPRTSALENVAMPLIYSSDHLSDQEASRRAEEMLGRVGLGDRLDHEPSQLSGGQQQRVAGSMLTSTTQSVSSGVSSSVNTLSNRYPGGQPSLYPERSQVQAVNHPMHVRFTYVDQILTAAQSTEEIPAAVQQINGVLRERHRLQPGEADDFTIRDMTEMTKTLTSTTTLMTNLLLCVALISLVVGGVGIMNIMLVSVTERTREIGLRMAVGARAGDILRQFLVEAVVLCLTGGAMGILLGHGGSWLIEKVLRWPVATSLTAIAAAVLVSAAVGTAFGFYPAWRASRLDPIEALRYE